VRSSDFPPRRLFLTPAGACSARSVAFRNAPLPSQGEILIPAIFPGPEFDTTSIDLALTIGGGLDVRVWRGFGVGADARHLRLPSDAQAFDFAFVLSRAT